MVWKQDRYVASAVALSEVFGCPCSGHPEPASPLPLFPPLSLPPLHSSPPVLSATEPHAPQRALSEGTTVVPPEAHGPQLQKHPERCQDVPHWRPKEEQATLNMEFCFLHGTSRNLKKGPTCRNWETWLVLKLTSLRMPGLLQLTWMLPCEATFASG